jgi:hypothetical protein
MTQDEIFALGIQAGLCDEFGGINMEYDYKNQILAFAKLLAEKEREACAQILANTDLSGLRDHPFQNWVAGMLFEFIKAIRARGQA